jgi:SAM-dependent methyltransferase
LRDPPVTDSKSGHTAKSFADKWQNNPLCAFDATLREGSDIQSWILNRNGFATTRELAEFLAGKKRILDAGCGNGRVTALLRKYAPPDAEIIGIDISSSTVARGNLEGSANVSFCEKNILDDLSSLGSFDFIYCQEVLHHTADPEKAFRNLCRQLSPTGEIAIYVYKKKAPVREYVDDYIRDKISNLPYQEAIRACRQLTELGKVLSELGVKAEIPAVELLDIEQGGYDIQRFLYHFFVKCFWNPELSYEDNVAINFDWYHPQLCSRHTITEVENWFQQARLEVTHKHVDHYGITIRGNIVDRSNKSYPSES